MHTIPLTVAALAVACAAYFTSLSAHGAECVETMPNVESTLSGQGVPYMVIDADDIPAFAEQVQPITGVAASDVTGALVADVGAGLIFGIETSDGCFSPQPMLFATASGPGA